MPPSPESDIKIMLPREWEPALVRAQGDATERTLTAYVRAIVHKALVNGKYLSNGVETEGGSSPSTPVAA